MTDALTMSVLGWNIVTAAWCAHAFKLGWLRGYGTRDGNWDRKSDDNWRPGCGREAITKATEAEARP